MDKEESAGLQYTNLIMRAPFFSFPSRLGDLYVFLLERGGRRGGSRTGDGTKTDVFFVPYVVSKSSTMKKKPRQFAFGRKKILKD